MKLSVSLPDEDVEFLDAYAKSQGIESRSAVVHKAVRLLRASELGASYEDAWQEWEDSAAANEWDAVAGDGLTDATR
ncbi:MAG: ribbon-helix-helix domain-containing protein [Acidimicrobiales bacterium]